MTRHFALRVAERIQPDLSATLLWQAIERAIEQGHPSVRYLGRLDREGRRAWAFTMGGREWGVVVCEGKPLTVLPVEWLIGGEA